MKLLLADQDRDFLMTYKKLLEYDGHSVTTVFDGAQALERLAGSDFDLVIVNKNIPMIGSRQIIRQLNGENIPSLVLLDRGVTPAILLDSEAACSYMNFPFFPYELCSRVKEIGEKAKSSRTILLNDTNITISHFREGSGVRFTNEEIELLTALQNGAKPDYHHISAYVNALNNKFEKLKKSLRIKYVLDHGYRLVNLYE